MPKDICIVTFPSTHFALRAERVARTAGIPVKMIPVPRHISADCTIGMEASVEQKAALKEILTKKGIECGFVTWPK